MTVVEQSLLSRFAEPGPTHDVDPADVFFSTTDDKGILLQANDVFVRLSRYSRGELLGAPHNIVRHPDMPAGVFHAMWRMLQEGQPFVGYIRNRAQDGSAYDVLAAVSPLPDGGYLSVRIPPLTDFFGVARSIYYGMNDLEHGLRKEGAGRREAGERGAGRLDEELVGRGYPSYEQLQWEILPTEVEERERRAPAPVLPEGAPGRHGELIHEVRGLFGELNEFMAAQQDMLGTIAALEQASRRLEEETAASVRVTGEMNRLDVDGPERILLLAPLQVWATMHGIVTDHVNDLNRLLQKLHEVGARTRFHIALARLHATMAADFVGRLDEESVAGSRLADTLPPLITALLGGVREMATQVAEHQRLSRRVEAKVRSTISVMDVPNRMISDWLADTAFDHFTPDVHSLVEEVRGVVAGAGESIRQLDNLAAHLDGETRLTVDALRQRMNRVIRATEEYLG